MTPIDPDARAKFKQLAREMLAGRAAQEEGIAFHGRSLPELLTAFLAVLVDANPAFWEAMRAIADDDMSALEELLS